LRRKQPFFEERLARFSDSWRDLGRTGVIKGENGVSSEKLALLGGKISLRM